MTRQHSPLSLALVLALGAAFHIPSAGAAQSTRAANPERPKPHRLIVLTDIEADPDDTQSLVRLLLYSNEIDIQGLIATTSVHRRAAVSPDSVRNVIHAYAAVYDNLLRHDSDYTEPEVLLGVVKQGLPVYGMQGVGEGKDSEGSDWIIKTLERNDDRPLWVSVWGGPNTLAQALFKLRATRSEQDATRLIAKLRVYAISDQDDTGPWMRREFRDLFYIVSPGGYGAGTWTGINHVIPGFDNTTISNRWLAENIQQGHGPLGAAYPDVAWGMEGDTPSWLSLVPNGLNAPDHPDWGGWGGRYELHVPELSTMDPDGFTGGVPVQPEVRPIWTNAVDEYRPPVAPEYGRATKNGAKSFKGFQETVWRWRDDFQNDFAARMAWTTKRFADANHPPVPAVDHADGITVRSGQTFALSARGSSDPDGDSLSYYWFQYLEAGTCKTPLKFLAAENTIAIPLAAPKVDRVETAHVILRVTDKGTPPLSRYERLIVTITP